MFKRIVALFSVICLLLAAMVGRLGFIITSDQYVSSGKNTVSLEIDTRRGDFYDRNMEKLTGTQNRYVAIIRPTEKVISDLPKLFQKEKTISIIEKLRKGFPIVEEVPTGTLSTANIPVITTSIRYSNEQLLSHLIGYYNKSSDNMFGLEKSYNDYLWSDSSVKIKYHVDAKGRMLAGDKGEIVSDNYFSKKGVMLTINKQIQEICENVADKTDNFEKGAIVVLDVKTGEILASVSRPNINQNKLEQSRSSNNSPFINRALTAYTVGSVFKILVASTAIEKGLNDFQHNCTGSIQIGSLVFNCHKEDGHGNVNMSLALQQSCNTYFIALGQEIGGTDLLKATENFGFGEQVNLSDDTIAQGGTLPKSNEINQKGNLANFSFGQGDLMATPLQIANLVACVANNGKISTPKLIKALIDDNGSIIKENNEITERKIINESTAEIVSKYLIETVSQGTGKNANPNNQLGAGGKTATAQTGWFDNNGIEVLHSWFAGFYPAENPQYAIAIVNEDGKSGSTDCCPIFKEIVENIHNIN